MKPFQDSEAWLAEHPFRASIVLGVPFGLLCWLVSSFNEHRIFTWLGFVGWQGMGPLVFGPMMVFFARHRRPGRR